MGSMIQATCTCGYQSEVLLEGGGMAGPQTSRDLARCVHCREIVSIRAGGTRPRCPTCRRHVVVMPPSQGDEDAYGNERPAVPAECPRCHQPRLVLDEVGVWD